MHHEKVSDENAVPTSDERRYEPPTLVSLGRVADRTMQFSITQ